MDYTKVIEHQSKDRDTLSIETLPLNLHQWMRPCRLHIVLVLIKPKNIIFEINA